MNTWTREHDALIARVAEGWEIVPEGEIGAGFWRGPDGVGHVEPPHYLTNLTAIARAQEAWRIKDDDIDRTYTIHSAVERIEIPFRVEMSENYPEGQNYEWRTFEGKADTESAARAWATWRACGGVE